MGRRRMRGGGEVSVTCLILAAFALQIVSTILSRVATSKRPHVARGEYVAWVRWSYRTLFLAFLLASAGLVVALTR
jgi:hypothetical protein